MKKIGLLFIALFFSLAASAQSVVPVKKTPPKPPAKPATTAKPSANEISETDWNEIARFLAAEDWDKTVEESAKALQKLKVENEKKQLARLRYVYVYALAGKVSQNKATVADLQAALQPLVGKMFIALDRKVLAKCDKALNFVCPVARDSRSLRVSAANKDYKTIHSLEKYEMTSEFNFAENNEKTVFVGGILRDFEINQDWKKVWILKLNFDNGWFQAL